MHIQYLKSWQTWFDVQYACMHAYIIELKLERRKGKKEPADVVKVGSVSNSTEIRDGQRWVRREEVSHGDAPP